MDITETPLQKEVGEQLKLIRKKKKLSLKQAADLCSKSFQDISRIERGEVNISLESIEKICTSYGISINLKLTRCKK